MANPTGKNQYSGKGTTVLGKGGSKIVVAERNGKGAARTARMARNKELFALSKKRK